jgi:hypothetical protein
VGGPGRAGPVGWMGPMRRHPSIRAGAVRDKPERRTHKPKRRTHKPKRRTHKPKRRTQWLPLATASCR